MNSIEKAIELLNPLTIGHTTSDEMYWVTISEDRYKLDPENMEEDGSGENFCEGCIENAVFNAHKQWTADRTELMGRIYEAEHKGYFTYHGYTHKGKSYKFKFQKQKCDKNCIASMKKELRKKYRLGTLFSSDYRSLSCGLEDNGFSFCEGCGEMFATSLLIDDQELEHWEELDDDSYTMLSNSEAYELIQILEQHGYSYHKLDNRIMELAERVCKLKSGCYEKEMK